MVQLNPAYLKGLENIAKKIQDSEELALFLSEEEDNYYEQLKNVFEPSIHNLHEQVANENPLQLVAFEQRLMADDFEGLFLPRLLGYSVLRGEISPLYKYTRSQEHFQDILMAICNSPNFEILKKRIGQSIQIGFALSSDIWITNLLAPIENKKIRYFLQSQKLDRFRLPEGRAEAYKIYKRQFRNFNYMTTDFPKDFGELKVSWTELKEFLVYRIERNLDNSSLLPFMKAFVERDEFKGHDEHLEILALYANFFDLGEDDAAHLYHHLNETRTIHKNFIEYWLKITLEMHESTRLDLDAYADARVYGLLDMSEQDDLTAYYELMATIHSVGYMHEETMEAVKAFYTEHEGRSLINECVRMSIFHYFARLLNNLEPRDYHELFDLAKIYTVYIKIFANAEFNLAVKALSMRFIEKCMKRFTDKRGKDYQDIKKFVNTTFQDLAFLSDKEVVELFKTRRKKKVDA